MNENKAGMLRGATEQRRLKNEIELLTGVREAEEPKDVVVLSPEFYEVTGFE